MVHTPRAAHEQLYCLVNTMCAVYEAYYISCVVYSTYMEYNRAQSGGLLFLLVYCRCSSRRPKKIDIRAVLLKLQCPTGRIHRRQTVLFYSRNGKDCILLAE